MTGVSMAVVEGHWDTGTMGETYFEKHFFGKFFVFLEAVYQLKKTSDCSQNDPPGPGQKKKSTKDPEILTLFCKFLVKKHVLLVKKTARILDIFDIFQKTARQLHPIL